MAAKAGRTKRRNVQRTYNIYHQTAFSSLRISLGFFLYFKVKTARFPWEFFQKFSGKISRQLPGGLSKSFLGIPPVLRRFSSCSTGISSSIFPNNSTGISLGVRGSPKILRESFQEFRKNSYSIYVTHPPWFSWEFLKIFSCNFPLTIFYVSMYLLFP